jgi:hypothetical protein
VEFRRKRLVVWSLLALALCVVLAFSASPSGVLFLPVVLIDLLWAPLVLWAVRTPAQPLRLSGSACGVQVCRAPPF